MQVSRWARCAAVLFCCLSFAAARSGTLSPAEVPGFAIPKMASPPKVDGTIDSVEWRESVAVSGVAEQASNVLIPRPTTYYLGWDSGHLYLACRTYARPGYKPAIWSGRSPGMAFVFDDGAEFVIKPMGRNVPVNNAHAAFRFFLNCLGYTGDTTKLDLGQQLKNWSPQFKSASRLTAAGTAPNGGRWCEVEMSATPADFELAGENRVSDEWRFMLGFDHMPGWMQARVPVIGGYFDADGGGYNRAVLVDNTPAVQFTMDSLSNLSSDGTASMEITAFNPASTTATLDVGVDVAGKIVRNDVLRVPAGGTSKFTLNEQLPSDTKEGKASVRVSEGDKPLLNYTAFFKVGELNWMMAPVTPPDPGNFVFQAKFSPLKRWLLIKADTYYLPDGATAKSLSYRVVPVGASSRSIAEGTLTKTAEWYFQERVQLPDLRAGKYTVESTMTLADGRKLGPIAVSFEKKNEAKAFPEWWGQKYGNVERVLPPFTAITRSDDAFSCWGRTYILSALGLPVAIKSQGQPVMASPARVVAVVNGKDVAIPLGKPTITEQKGWRIRFTGQARGAGLSFSATGWLEQDGLVYVELTYSPNGSKPVKVDGLRIEYPLSDVDAECLTCIGPGANFSSKTTMILPADKKGQLWSTLVTGRAGSSMTVGSFYPTVWIGSERRGLVWWADNDEGWFPVDEIPAHEAVREGTSVVLRNNIIGKPVQLTGPRTIRFSYNATPFRAFTKGWRMVGATEDGTFDTPFRGLRKDSRTGEMVDPGAAQQNWIHPESRYPEEWTAIWAEQKTQTDAWARGCQWYDPYDARNGHNFTHMSFALHGYGRKTIIDSLYDYFGPEWEGDTDTWNESYIDYAMYLFDGALREGGVRSTYWDITFPTEFSNLLSGLCYRLPDGRVQKGYNGWNLRRFFMRLQSMMVDNHLFPNAVGSHSTNAYVPVAMPWLDAVLDGERNWNLDSTSLDWVDYYPIERMRAMSTPESWGTPVCWMAILDSASPEKRDAGKKIQAQWVWMHDSWRNPYIPQLPRMPDAILDWGISSDQTVYHPYWRNPFVTSNDKDVLVSLWQLPDRVMLGIFNYDGKSTKDASLKIDLDKLGLVPKLQWQEFVGVRDLWKADDKAPASQLDFYGRTLSVKGLQPHTSRFIGIRRY